MKNGSCLISLCSVMLLASVACGQDFNVIAPKELPDFDVIEPLEISLLDVCDCEITGVCDCDTCECRYCPNKKKAKKKAKVKDDRPVITVRTMAGCAPCKRAEADTEKLSDYRFVFLESDHVPGGAPAISWQGRDGKYTINGWHGSEFFERVFSNSQKAKIERPQSYSRRLTPFRHHWSDYPVVPSFSTPVGSCAGEACHTCR